MAIGDAAAAAGLALVPSSGSGGEVALGYQEINRTRDYVANVMTSIPDQWAVTQGGTGASTPGDARNNLGIYSGTGAANDTNGGNVNGNIYFKIVS
jgi:hypothetical protein